MSGLQTPENISAYIGNGTESVPNAGTGLVTLTATDDYYFPIPMASDADVVSIHILTDANLAGTFTVETCNFPRKKAKGAGATDVTDYDETSGNWIKENPSDAYVASVGTGWTWTALTGAKTAGAAGAMIHLGNIGSRRVRLKVAATTTGAARVVAHCKGKM